MVLFTPGPCMTSESVRQAGAAADVNHRQPVYDEIVSEIRQQLTDLADGMEPFLIGGSGSAGMEAMLTSCVDQGPVLVLVNGYYSKRLVDILDVHRIPYELLAFDWLKPWDLNLVESRLASRRFEAVVGVHHETTTGRLNPVDLLAQVAARYGARVLVDAISSLGADPLDFSGVHAVCSSTNKCLHGLPGISFVMVEPSFSKALSTFPKRTFYLSLPMYKGPRPPLTPPVATMASFRQALHEFSAQGGREGRERLYQQRAAIVRSAARSKGYALAVPESESSCSLTCIELPTKATWDQWFQRNLDLGYVLYGCKGELRERFYQVGHMGEFPEEEVVWWAQALPPQGVELSAHRPPQRATGER